MTIPVSSVYPDNFDTDTNLYLVHDSLRITLIQDYNPGDTTITVDTTQPAFAIFPPTGLITLTEQCSDIDLRAISFFYNSITSTGFAGLEILPGFVDVVKPKNITDVTMNVMADHHNNIKNAAIAIEEFCGVRGTTDTRPFGPTLEGRINFLRNLVLQPKAWFTVNQQIGIVPFTVAFTNQSFRLGTTGTNCDGPVTFIWDFGDESISTISIVEFGETVTSENVEIITNQITGGTINKTYTNPGVFTPKLTVINNFGKNTVEFQDMIQARLPAPELAVIDLEPTTKQILLPGPMLRTPVNNVIFIDVPPGPDPNRPGFSYAGEALDGGGKPLDPITNYTWNLGDDLPHDNSPITRASYSIGGLYDVILRTDTEFGAYRITFMDNAIDVVEVANLWLWNYAMSPMGPPLGPGQVAVSTYEYGLLSETFKIKANNFQTLNQDPSFLASQPNSAQQTREFLRNNAFAPRSTTTSGAGGTVMLFNATGRTAIEPVSAEQIQISEYNGFTDTYTNLYAPINRPWNWAPLVAPSQVYFFLGYPTSAIAPNTSPTNQSRVTLPLMSLAPTTDNLTLANYLNGAQELQNNVAVFESGQSVYGNFSVYRTAWKDNTGYIIRNDGVGPFFRLKSFYRTEGSVASPFMNVRKLPDMPGSTKLEGQLVALSAGVFFFNNSGAISAYNDASGVWETGGPGANSGTFRLLQDQTAPGFDDPNNTLLAASDGDKKAYLSFDYSPNAFIKFNLVDLTFSTLGSRPAGNQWLMGIY
jgi:PKD repeat protein